jgi:predicted HTH domain antitoxin
MKSLKLEVPDSLLVQSGASLEELSREAQAELAFHYFRSGRLTSGQAAEMVGMNRVDFLKAASARRIPLIDLDADELAREIKIASGQ